MSRAKLAIFSAFALALSQFLHAVDAARQATTGCQPSSCGNLTNISSPLRLKGDPSQCGDPHLELVCDNKRTIVHSKYGISFYVEAIFYDEYGDPTLQVVDTSLDSQKCSIPAGNNFRCGFDWIYFVSCKVPIRSPLYIDATPCSIASSSPPHPYFYALFGGETLKATDFDEACTVQAQIPKPSAYRFWNSSHNNISGLTIFDIHREFLVGYDVSSYCIFDYPDPRSHVTLAKILWRLKFIISNYFLSFKIFFSHGISFYAKDRYYTSGTQFASIIITGVVIIIRTLLGFSCVIAVMVYKFRRRHLSQDDTIEEFLQLQTNFMPIRYSYYEIKRITNCFEDKLGEGGYGSVFKGKLRSGRFVAIKLLGKSKSQGQDFINEVATIGRIHHVNVVRLIGFCVEGSKQALVYDFMPNGSLDKIIFSTENNVSLSWEKLYEIAIGVARGIEYLHQGCEMQILHFDIKPHNILLDENFTPKISDFGLAKLYAVDDSIVSLTAARGTLGYIAPELFYKNIGSVSHKADVYSFGMLLMEMVGKRRNLNERAEQSSQIYFPAWIYDRLEIKVEEKELGGSNESEKKILRKMVIAAFWCIQTKPSERPSISEVLQMLEGEVELLQMPPKPFLLSNSLGRSSEDFASINYEEEPSTSLNS